MIKNAADEILAGISTLGHHPDGRFVAHPHDLGTLGDVLGAHDKCRFTLIEPPLVYQETLRVGARHDATRAFILSNAF